MKFQPDTFALEKTTVWSFKERGDWATHKGSYRGNWSPYVPRNLIMRYSKPGDWLLDQFTGSGTTLIEAKLLNRNAIGIDINLDAIKLTKENLQFSCAYQPKIFIRQADSTNLAFIKSDSIDFICSHPPYANIIKYSSNLQGDLSCLTVSDFLKQMTLVAKDAYRVLKQECYCAIMIGDIRRKGKVFPLGFELMKKFLEQGFVLQDIIIKEQHNCRSSAYWEAKKVDFLLLAHEYIFVFKK